MRGEVVGINSQIFTTSGGYKGISFAIPIDEAMHVQRAVAHHGRVIRGRIGVGIDEVTQGRRRPRSGWPRPQGALVQQRRARAARREKAGVEAGDIILQVRRSHDRARRAICRASSAARKPGATVSMTVFRKGKPSVNCR